MIEFTRRLLVKAAVGLGVLDHLIEEKPTKKMSSPARASVPGGSMAERDYEAMMGQTFVAFGQGLDNIRVSREACLLLRDHCLPVIKGTLGDHWDVEAVQFLERIMGVGRLSMVKATQRADTVVSFADLKDAINAIMGASATAYCPPLIP